MSILLHIERKGSEKSMNKLYLYLFEPFNNLSKRLYITIITILFLSAFFFFIGVFSNVFNTENLSLSLRNNEIYLTYHQMYLVEPFETRFNPNAERIYQVMNHLIQNEPEERRRIEKETDRFICDLYNMQNDDFIMERFMYRTFQIPGLPELFDQNFIQADESFFLHEYLPICKGRGIIHEDFEEIRNAKSPDLIINVIAGYSYMEYYEIGDILSMEDDGTQSYFSDYDGSSEYTLGLFDQDFAKYRIVGFLEKGVTTSNPSGGIHSTDDQIFVPTLPQIGINFPEITEQGAWGVSTEIPTWKFLIRKGKTDEYADIINQKLNGLFIDKYYDFVDSSNNTRAILDEVVSARNDSFIIIAIILLIFSVSGIIVSTVNKFKTNIRSYTVHMTVGATNKDIYAFSAIEMLMQIIIALAIAHIPFILSFLDIPILRFINRNIPYMHSSSMYLMIMIFTVLFIAVTVAVTAWCIKKYSLAEILKGKE